MNIKINDSNYIIYKEKINEIQNKKKFLIQKRYWRTIFYGSIINFLIGYFLCKEGLLIQNKITIIAIASIGIFPSLLYALIGALFITTKKERILNEEVSLFSQKTNELEVSALETYLQTNLSQNAPKDLQDFVRTGYYRFE